MIWWKRYKLQRPFAVKNGFSKHSYIKFTMKKYPEHNSINLALKKSTLVENTFETVFTRNWINNTKSMYYLLITKDYLELYMWTNVIVFTYVHQWSINWICYFVMGQLIGPSLDLLNYSSNRLKHCIFEHQTNSEVFIFW